MARGMVGSRVVLSTYVRLEDVQELERAGEFDEFWEAIGKVERMKARARARTDARRREEAVSE